MIKISLNNIESRKYALEEHENIVGAISQCDENLAEKEARKYVINAKKSFIESYN